MSIADFSQVALRYIVFVDLPELGDKFDSKDSFRSVKSIKVASNVYAPMGGKVLEVNKALAEKPGLMNGSAKEDA